MVGRYPLLETHEKLSRAAQLTTKNLPPTRDEGLLRGTTPIRSGRCFCDRPPLDFALTGDPGRRCCPMGHYAGGLSNQIMMPSGGRQASSNRALRGRCAGLTPHNPDSLANVLLLLFEALNDLLLFMCAADRARKQQQFVSNSGPEGIRTPGLLNAIEARSQLRYRPKHYFFLNTTALTSFYICYSNLLAPVDLRGFEPLASSVRLRRAPNCATGPFVTCEQDCNAGLPHCQGSKLFILISRGARHHD